MNLNFEVRKTVTESSVMYVCVTTKIVRRFVISALCWTKTGDPFYEIIIETPNFLDLGKDG